VKLPPQIETALTGRDCPNPKGQCHLNTRRTESQTGIETVNELVPAEMDLASEHA